MQDHAYADALRQSPVYVFKLWLFPYSLRHEGLLLAERNAFLTESGPAFDKLPLEQRILALDRATQVCSNFHFQKFQTLRGWLLKKARGNFTEEHLSDEVNKFWDYLNTSRCYPRLSHRRVKSGEEPGRPFGAPLLAQLHQFVMTLPEIQKISNSQEMVNSAWDYPFGAAVWRYFTSMEMEGSVQIENDDEEKIRVERARIQNDYNDGTKAWSDAKTDAEKLSAIAMYPSIREFAATCDEVAAFEKKGLK